MRCAGRLVEALPQGRRHRGRVRGGPRGADAAALHHVRPDQMGEPQGRQVRADRHRLEPVSRRPGVARKEALGRGPLGQRADHRPRHRGDRRWIPPDIRAEPVHAAGPGTGHARARGQTRILEGIVDTPRFPRGRARMARRGRFQTPRAEPQIDRRGMRRRRFRQRGRGREPGDSRQARLGVGRIHARHPRPARTRRRRRRHHRRRARPGRFITGDGGKEAGR